MIKTILVVPRANDAEAPGVARAVAVAKARHADVVLLGLVYEPLLEGYMGNKEIYAPLRRRLVEETRKSYDELARELQSKGVRCKTHVVWGRDRHEIVAKRVVKDRADLVVTEPSGDAGTLSHADWKLVSTCPAPILVVRGDGRKPYRHVVAAVDPCHEHAKPAELDSAIIRNAKAFAELGHGELQVVHCFVSLDDLVAADLIELPAAHAEVALEKARREALTALVAEEGMPAESATLLTGRPEVALAALAERGEADLFVLGAASRGRIKEFFVGSTAERLLHTTKADTLIVKPPGFEVRVSLDT